MQDRIIIIEDTEIHYKVHGEGQPLILVHGLSGSTTWWRHNIEPLSRFYTVYLIDLPGFGRMRKYGNQFSLEKAAEWLYKWIESVELKKVSLVGHSMGAFICMKVAAEHSEMIDKLILVDPAGMYSGRTILNSLRPLSVAALYARPTFFPILALDALKAGPRILLKTAKEIFAQDIRNDLKKITRPTLLIWGEKDSLIPIEYSAIYQQELKNSELYIIKRAGHVPMFDKPQEFNNAVLSFLRN